MYIAVMYLEHIVEIGPIQQVLGNPQHLYTKALLSVAPVPNPRQRREHSILQCGKKYSKAQEFGTRPGAVPIPHFISVL